MLKIPRDETKVEDIDNKAAANGLPAAAPKARIIDGWMEGGVPFFLPVFLEEAALHLTHAGDAPRSVLVGDLLEAVLPRGASAERLRSPAGKDVPLTRATIDTASERPRVDEIPEEQRELILELNQFDTELYEYGRKLFEETVPTDEGFAAAVTALREERHG